MERGALTSPERCNHVLGVDFKGIHHPLPKRNLEPGSGTIGSGPVAG